MRCWPASSPSRNVCQVASMKGASESNRSVSPITNWTPPELSANRKLGKAVKLTETADSVLCPSPRGPKASFEDVSWPRLAVYSNTIWQSTSRNFAGGTRRNWLDRSAAGFRMRLDPRSDFCSVAVSIETLDPGGLTAPPPALSTAVIADITSQVWCL
jgi:hypothetical protein